MPDLALLIDGENVSAKFLPKILNHVSELGDPVVKCVFGDFSDNRLAEWAGLARDNGLDLIFQISGGKGKNTTDIALTIRAMELLHCGRMDGFCLASSDRDFVPLVTKLRQNGKKIYGFGEAKSDQALRTGFTRFFTLAAAAPKVANKPAKKTPTPKPEKKLHPRIAELITKLAKEDPDRWVHLSPLAEHIRREIPKIADEICGNGKFLKNLTKTGQIEQIGNGCAKRIRLLRSKSAAMA